MKDGLVNWTKFSQIARSAAIVLDCHRHAPELPINRTIESLICECPAFSLEDNELYDLSYAYRKRGTQSTTTSRSQSNTVKRVQRAAIPIFNGKGALELISNALDRFLIPAHTIKPSGSWQRSIAICTFPHPSILTLSRPFISSDLFFRNQQQHHQHSSQSNRSLFLSFRAFSHEYRPALLCSFSLQHIMHKRPERSTYCKAILLRPNVNASLCHDSALASTFCTSMGCTLDETLGGATS